MLPARRFHDNWIPDVFNDFFDNNWLERTHSTTPAVNVLESEKSYDVEVAAPGMTKDDFKVSLDENGDLVINLDKKRTRQTTLFETDDVPHDDEIDHYFEKMRTRYHFDFRKNMDRILAVDKIHGVSEHMRIQRMKDRKR